MLATRPSFEADRALWLVQWPLSIALFLEGLLKAGLSAGDLPARLHSAVGAPAGPLALAGTLEVILALALVLPAATRCFPSLTPVAAGCLALGLATAAGGAGVPIGTGVAWLDLGAAAAAALVAWGRVVAAPVAPLALGPEPTDPLRRAAASELAGEPARGASGAARVGRGSNPGSLAA